MDPITLAALIVGALSLVGTIGTAAYSAHEAREADSRALENQKDLMRYETELQQQTNTIATQKGHAVQAGYNPALLYGSMSAPGLADVSGGSSQGTMPSMPELFQRIGTREVSESIATARQQQMARERMESDIALNDARRLDAIASANEKMRDTGVKRRLEQTIIDQATANLELTQAQKENTAFQTQRGIQMLPLELEQSRTITALDRKRMEEVDENIKRSSIERKHLSADIARINKSVDLMDTEKRQMQESLRNSQFDRVMKQFGIGTRTARLNRLEQYVTKTGSQFLDSERLKSYFTNPMRAAWAELVRLGYSEYDATYAVMFYTAEDPKDVSPSIVNAVSRGLSSLILKK